MTMYFIALVLPPDLNEMVLHWKNFMHRRYQCKVGLKSPAHITLVPPFWMEEEKEEVLLQDIATIGRNLYPFSMQTKNFSAFKPRTIFIDVEKNEELNRAKEIVDDFFRLNSFYKIKIDTREFHPHITIATRDLFKKSFYEAWPVFEKENFKEEWQVSGLSVLRHNKKNWDVIYTSQFSIKDKS
jgi:2'-5' RNA ligase